MLTDTVNGAAVLLVSVGPALGWITVRVVRVVTGGPLAPGAEYSAPAARFRVGS